MKGKRILTLAVSAWLGAAALANAQPAFLPSKTPKSEAREYPLPPMPATPNPALAESVAASLKESGALTRCRLQVTAVGGVVDLRGEVADAMQQAAIINIARSTPGVAVVRDWMQVRPDHAVMQTQGPGPAPLIQPLPLPLPQPQPQPMPPDLRGPVMPPRIDGLLPEPMPIFQPMPGPNPMMQPPPMPPYAWPTYAPYNNYSRVAYPQAYPYEQFPFIGPMYPFPRVPLGWRSVSLTWEDGHWWFHRNPTGHDWWRIRYW